MNEGRVVACSCGHKRYCSPKVVLRVDRHGTGYFIPVRLEGGFTEEEQFRLLHKSCGK